jgi:hypothetical protein
VEENKGKNLTEALMMFNVMWKSSVQQEKNLEGYRRCLANCMSVGYCTKSALPVVQVRRVRRETILPVISILRGLSIVNIIIQ